MKTLNKIYAFVVTAIAFAVHAFYQRTYVFHLNPGQYPTLDDFTQAMVVQEGAIEVIRQPIYDYQLYPTAGLTLIQFFQTQVGQGLSVSPGNANNAKTLNDTNMLLGGQLPAPQAYYAESIEINFDPGSVSTANTYTIQDPSAAVAAAAAAVQAGAHDVNAVYSTGALTFTIGMKPYYQEGPLYRFPSRQILRLDGATASNSATAVESIREKMSIDGDILKFDPGLAIMTSLNFGVTLTWPALVPTPSGFNGRLGVILDGWLYRAVQ